MTQPMAQPPSQRLLRQWARTLWAAGCMGLALPGHAQDTAAPSWDASRVWLNAGFYSAHFNANAGLRNANPGIGLQYPINPDWAATAGRFVNSDNARSHYVGVYYQPWRAGAWKLGAVAGLFDGYPKAFGGGWFPAALPVATYTAGQWGLNVALVPPLHNRLYGAVSFQLMFRLKDEL